MFSNNKTSSISSKLVSAAKFAGSKTALAAAVAVTSLSLTGSTFGSISDITAVTTTMSTGTASTVNGVAGYGNTSSYSIYKATNTYTMQYLGQDAAIKSVKAGSLGTYNVSGSGVAVVRRSTTGGNNDTIWENGNGNGSNHSTVTLNGPMVTGFTQAFNSNNLLMGADNIFSNMGNAVGNNTNVDRIDLLFTGGLKASTANAFSIFDRGPVGDHDAFKIAAITSLINGAPASYGTLFSFADGTWGGTTIANVTTENIVRKNDSLSNDPLHPSDQTSQPIGGVLIQTSSLVPAGTTIYGYSLFSPTVTGTGSQLVDWTNSTYFPPADSASTGGGLDPAATLSNLYTATSSVPEPTTGALAAMVIGGVIARRPKRKLA